MTADTPPKNDAARELYFALQEVKAERDLERQAHADTYTDLRRIKAERDAFETLYKDRPDVHEYLERVTDPDDADERDLALYRIVPKISSQYPETH